MNQDKTLSTQEDMWATPYPLRYLGMGLVLTWDWCMSMSAGIGTAPILPHVWIPINFILVLAEALALLMLAALSRRIGAISHHRSLCIAGPICALAGALCLQVPIGALAATGGCLVGIATAFLLLWWAEVYGRFDSGRVLLYGSLSLLTGGVVYGLISQVSALIQIGATYAVPLISFMCCWLSSHTVGREDISGRQNVHYSFPTKPVIIMAVCGFSAAFVDVALFAQGTLPHILADVITGALVLLAFVVLKRRIQPVALVGFSLICAAAGILWVALAGPNAAFAASLLTMTSYVAATFFACALMADMCHRRQISSLWLFGFALGARVIADHLGGFASMVYPDLSAAAGSHLHLAIMAVVGLLMIGVIALMWMTEKSFSSDWAVQTLSIADGQRVRSEMEVYAIARENASRTAGLTEREAQVFEMLLDGATYAQICQALFLSPNTVKTHARHVYTKLGVHTREEAIALVRDAAK